MLEIKCDVGRPLRQPGRTSSSLTAVVCCMAIRCCLHLRGMMTGEIVLEWMQGLTKLFEVREGPWRFFLMVLVVAKAPDVPR
jgi:hypothetical protein